MAISGNVMDFTKRINTLSALTVISSALGVPNLQTAPVTTASAADIQNAVNNIESMPDNTPNTTLAKHINAHTAATIAETKHALLHTSSITGLMPFLAAIVTVSGIRRVAGFVP